MNYETLQTEVRNLILDPSARILGKIPDFINEALLEASGRVLLPGLKKLRTISTVTDQAWSTLPSGSSGKLVQISHGDENAGEIEILDGGVEDLIQRSGNGDIDTNEGDISIVALDGQILWYQNVPASAETLFLVLYIDPTVLSAPSDEPSIIPEFLHRDILVHGVASIAFREIEQDVEDVKNETDTNQRFFELGLIKLQEWADSKKRHVGKSGNYWSY